MQKFDDDTKEFLTFAGMIAVLVFIFILVLWGGAATYKVYGVWSAKKYGEAQLAEATYSRQIAVKEADAKAAAAVELARAEVIRAHGVAEANKIIGDSLNHNESYLRYLWIQTLDSKNNKVIYVPTEANLPILEATRLHNK